jgi:hypothetical protein
MPVIAAFNISVPLGDNHIGRSMSSDLDCLHYCTPGVPEVRVLLLCGQYESCRDLVVKVSLMGISN